jgi:hypothetical protein
MANFSGVHSLTGGHCKSCRNTEGNAPAKDATDCCTQCFSAEWAGKGCSFFTFEGESTSVGGTTAGGTCWFKTNDHGPALQRLGCISGGHPSTPPPAPPKPCNKWVTPAEASADNSAFLLTFSAVCFMTVRDIARQHTHDRPMGLIQSAWGGSRLEAWMSDEALASAGAPVAGNIPLNNNKSPAGAANVRCTVRQKFALEDVIGSHACLLEALTCV